MIACRLKRDSVCMADDIDAPHRRTIRIALSPDESDPALVCVRAAVKAENYLPSVAGGSTWTARAGDCVIAVVTKSAWLDRVRVYPVGGSDGVTPSELRFAYRLATPPKAVLAELNGGTGHCIAR